MDARIESLSNTYILYVNKPNKKVIIHRKIRNTNHDDESIYLCRFPYSQKDGQASYKQAWYIECNSGSTDDETQKIAERLANVEAEFINAKGFHYCGLCNPNRE